MATTEVTISYRPLARELDIPEDRIQAVVDLLDAGNTVPFITRYRKDQTGGLDEEKIRAIFERVKKLRQLAERKQTILRAIEAQNKLTPTLAKKILAATSLRRLDDLYLPYRPKKQTLATLARERGLGHLAEEILTADPICADLDKRAADYIDPDKKVLSIADALLGAGHILAEIFSENSELRARLRDVIMRTGVIRTSRAVAETPATAAPPAPASSPGAEAGDASAAVTPAAETSPAASTEASSEQRVAAESTPDSPVSASSGEPTPPPAADAASEPSSAVPVATTEDSTARPTVAQPAESQTTSIAGGELQSPVQSQEVTAAAPSAEIPPGPGVPLHDQIASEGQPAAGTTGDAPEASATTSQGDGGPAPEIGQDGQATVATPDAATAGAAQVTGAAHIQPKAAAASKVSVDPRKAAKEAEKRRKEEQRIKEFADYFDFKESVRSIPPHRILAVNRGEALKILRVKIEADMAAMEKVLDEVCIPKDHPHADFLRGCARDALTRLILPSLEREIRRELTERAEKHAVKVFAHNLRRLLLQRPVRDRRVLAIDPGYRQGCKLAALDECGNVLDHGLIYLVEKRGYTREMAKQTVIEMINKHNLTAIAIGNGSGCRLAEVFVAELLENELKGRGIGYTIVNEAGASVYSTSQIGREELPHLDATYRGAVSIGRRLLDPLSELVKIEPANLGVGMYQHDLKEKHLRESLDEVVESCVNYVGVDVNTASPALLGYISGLNKLTARRIVEYRQQHGAFKTREELKKVPGIGEATFVQAAGFLKISGGENPLDATWIHPESYELAHRVLEKLGFSPEDLTKPDRRGELAERIAQVNAESLAAELNCGVLLLKDILSQFVRPGRDPREDLPPPVFKQGVIKLEDLSPGMELMGTVVNVVDFGAFVDVGLPNTGLIHRSRMKSNTLGVNPHAVVSVGDVVRVWVVEVDRDRRRISLSLVPLDQMAEKRTGNGKVARAAEARPARGKERKPAGPPAGEKGEHKAAETKPAETAEPRRRPSRPPRVSRSEEPVSQTAPVPAPISRPVELPRQRGRSEPPPPPEPLSEDVLAGKQPMRSFSDLFQYFAAKGVVRPTAPSGRGEKHGGKGRPQSTDSQQRRRESAGQSSKPAQASPPEATRKPQAADSQTPAEQATHAVPEPSTGGTVEPVSASTPLGPAAIESPAGIPSTENTAPAQNSQNEAAPGAVSQVPSEISGDQQERPAS